MHVGDKLTKYDGEDFYNDECNIDDMEEKFAVPDEIVLLLEGNKETGTNETSALLSNGREQC